MAKRLEVILKDPEYREIQRLARARHMTLAEWILRALDTARRRESLSEVVSKLDAIRMAARGDFPTGDIDQMLKEIERSYGGPHSCP